MSACLISYLDNFIKKNMNQSLKFKTQIRKILANKIEQLNGVFYLSPLTIGNYFAKQTSIYKKLSKSLSLIQQIIKNQLYMNDTNETKKQQLNHSLKQQYQEMILQFKNQLSLCIQYSFQKLRKKISSFINKDNDQQQRKIRISIILRIYYTVLYFKKSGNPIEIPYAEIDNFFSYQQKVVIENFISKNTDKQLFLIISQPKNMKIQKLIKLYCNSGFLVKLLESISFENNEIQKITRNIVSDIFRIFYNKKSSMGNPYQNILIQSLLINESKLQLKINDNSQFFQINNQENGRAFLINSIKKSKKYQILQQLRLAITSVIKFNKQQNKNRQNILGCQLCLPRQTKNQSQTGTLIDKNQYSPVIDFILIKQGNKKNGIKTIEIIIIDASITQTKSQISDKVEKFFKYFLNFKDKNKNSLIIKYLNQQGQPEKQEINVELKYYILGVHYYVKTNQVLKDQNIKNFIKINNQKPNKIKNISQIYQLIEFNDKENSLLKQIAVIQREHMKILFKTSSDLNQQTKLVKSMYDALIQFFEVKYNQIKQKQNKKYQ